MPNQDTDGNRMIWDETLRQWVPVTGSLSPAELANEINPILSSRYAPLAVDQFVDPFPAWFGGGTVNESIADIVAEVDLGPASVFVPATALFNIGASPTLGFVTTPGNALFRVPAWLLDSAAELAAADVLAEAVLEPLKSVAYQPEPLS